MGIAEIAVFGINVAFMGAVLTLFWRFRKPPEVITEPREDCEPELRRVRGELQELELRFTRLVEHVDERTEHATKTWRKIRARESREEQLEEPEGEWELPGGDATRGNGQGMLPLHEGVGAQSDPLEEARRIVAAQYQGGGGD